MAPTFRAMTYPTQLLPAIGLSMAVCAMAWPRAAGALPALAWAPMLLCAATGLVTGFLSGLLGIGGALVVVPALYLLLPMLGVPEAGVPHMAASTSLLAMIPTALAAALGHYRRGGLHGPWLARMAPGMVLGAVAGGLLIGLLRGPVLSMMFALQALYYGWGLVRRGPHTASCRPRPAWVERCLRCPHWLAAPGVAAFCACAGMGGGSMCTPYLCHKGLPMLQASATSSALNVCIAGSASLTLIVLHAGAGLLPADVLAPMPVHWPVALILGGTALLSVAHGVCWAHRLPTGLFSRLIGTVNLFGGAALTLRTVWVSA